MTTTVQVAISVRLITGMAMPNGWAEFSSTTGDINGALVVGTPVLAQLDGNGDGTAALVPNSVSTRTVVRIFDANRNVQFSGYASIPAYDCNLHDFINLSTPSVDDAQRAVNDARDAANDAANDAAATAADRVQTGLDRTQTGLDVQSADDAEQVTQGYMLTAIAQAALAVTMAASVASVAQQDLSGTVAAALHRSPNPVVATCFMDTSKDSNPGWPAQVDASYLYETLNGAYIPHPNVYGVPSEIVARALGGTLSSTNLLAAANNTLTGWTTNGTAALSLGTSNRLRVANTTNSGAANFILSLTAGKVYVIHADTYIGTNNALPGLRISNDGGASWNVLTATQTASGVFVAPTTGNYTVQFYSQNTQATWYFEVGNIALQEVTAFAPSGSYYPNATDGKFYRLWKNLASDSEFANGIAVNTSLDDIGGLVTPTLFPGVVGNTGLAFGRNGVNNARLYRTNYTVQQGLPYVVSILVSMDDGAGPPTFSAAPDLTLVLGGSFLDTATYSVDVVGTNLYRVRCAAIAANTSASFGVVKFNNASTRTFKTSGWQLQLGTAFDSYEKKTTDGSQTETFRGNKARAPRLGVPSAEAGRVVVYDALEPGRPMWMVLPTTGALNVGNIACLDYRGGVLLVGGGAGLGEVDFGLDQIRVRTNAGVRIQERISTRLVQNLGPNNAAGALIALVVNGIASCDVPGAPVHPITRLQAPLVALAQAGATILKPDGSIVSSVAPGTVHNVTATPELVTFGNSGSGTLYYAQRPNQLGASFAVSQLSGTGNQWSAFAQNGVKAANRHTYARRSGTRLSFMRFNEMNPAASLFTEITDTSNTGLTAGDNRRCLLADTLVGAASGAEQMQDPGFDTGVGWTLGNSGAGAGSSTISGGFLQSPRAADGSWFTYASQPYATVPGKTYQIVLTNGAGGTANVRVGASAMALDNGNFGAVAASSSSTFSFTATFTTTYISVFCSQNGTTANVDSCSVKEVVVDRSYKAKNSAIFGALTRAQAGVGTQIVLWSGWSAANYVQETVASTDLDPATGSLFVPFFFTIPTNVAAAGWAVDRSAAAGAGYKIGHDATGKLTATLTDGTNTRTVTTAAAYNTGTVIAGALLYEPSGAVTIIVNGERVASTAGAPLGSLSNASATLTVGIDRGLTAPWAGSLALMHLGMTAPTDDAVRFKYQQERAMFRDGAQVTLPDSGACVDLDYDPQTDCWRVASAANESEFHGLVRTASTPAAAGSISKIAGRHGIKAVARITTNPGVDITMPSQNLKEELLRKGEQAAAERARGEEMFDWSGGFTGTLTSGLNTITSVSGISIPPGATIKGAQISHANLPAGTTIVDQVGTTVYLSANATGTAAGTAIGFLDFIFPAGIEARRQTAAGLTKQEGSTKDYTRQFDGFRDRARYGTAPGAAVAVLGNGRRMLS